MNPSLLFTTVGVVAAVLALLTETLIPVTAPLARFARGAYGWSVRRDMIRCAKGARSPCVNC